MRTIAAAPACSVPTTVRRSRKPVRALWGLIASCLLFPQVVSIPIAAGEAESEPFESVTFVVHSRSHSIAPQTPGNDSRLHIAFRPSAPARLSALYSSTQGLLPGASHCAPLRC